MSVVVTHLFRVKTLRMGVSRLGMATIDIPKERNGMLDLEVTNTGGYKRHLTAV